MIPGFWSNQVGDQCTGEDSAVAEEAKKERQGANSNDNGPKSICIKDAGLAIRQTRIDVAILQSLGIGWRGWTLGVYTHRIKEVRGTSKHIGMFEL